MSDTIEIGYWEIRGLAASLRMICEYKQCEYINTTYAGGAEWFKSRKVELIKKNPLINLPFVIDGDVVVTQSNSCLTYLGRKFDLNGQTPEEVTKVEQILCQVMDLRNSFTNLCYHCGNYAEDSVQHLSATVPNHLHKLDAWLQHHQTKFCASNQPTVADFHMFEMLDQHQAFAKSLSVEDLLSQYPTLKQYHANFKAIPELRSYFTGENYALPINNKGAHFK